METKEFILSMHLRKADESMPDWWKEMIYSAMEEYRNQSRWISVEERLPERNGYYFTWCAMPEEPGLIHYHKDTGWQNGFYNEKVTHWQLLSKPEERT